MWTRNLERMRTNSEFKERVKDAARRVVFATLDYFKSENIVSGLATKVKNNVIRHAGMIIPRSLCGNDNNPNKKNMPME